MNLSEVRLRNEPRKFLKTKQDVRCIAILPIDLARDIINKRQQAGPGLMLLTKSFGIGRRFLIAQRFYE